MVEDHSGIVAGRVCRRMRCQGFGRSGGLAGRDFLEDLCRQRMRMVRVSGERFSDQRSPSSLWWLGHSSVWSSTVRSAVMARAV